MVAGPGIEPGTRAYETRVLPLHYPAAVLERSERIELSTTDWKSVVLPLN